MVKTFLSSLALTLGLLLAGSMFLTEAEASPVAPVAAGDTIKAYIGTASPINRIDEGAVQDNYTESCDIIWSYFVCEGVSTCIDDALTAMINAYSDFVDDEEKAWDDAVASEVLLQFAVDSGTIGAGTYTTLFNNVRATYNSASTAAATAYATSINNAFVAFCTCLLADTDCKC